MGVGLRRLFDGLDEMARLEFFATSTLLCGIYRRFMCVCVCVADLERASGYDEPRFLLFTHVPGSSTGFSLLPLLPFFLDGKRNTGQEGSVGFRDVT